MGEFGCFAKNEPSQILLQLYPQIDTEILTWKESPMTSESMLANDDWNSHQYIDIHLHPQVTVIEIRLPFPNGPFGSGCPRREQNTSTLGKENTFIGSI
jgi:hypothetical protein